MRQPVIAFLLAPLGALVVLAVTATIVLASYGLGAVASTAATGQSLWIFLLFGLPICYVVQGLVLVVVGLKVANRARVLLMGGVAGALVMPVLWRGFGPVIAREGAAMIVVGALAGAMSAAVFHLASRGSDPAKSAD